MVGNGTVIKTPVLLSLGGLQCKLYYILGGRKAWSKSKILKIVDSKFMVKNIFHVYS